MSTNEPQDPVQPEPGSPVPQQPQPQHYAPPAPQPEPQFTQVPQPGPQFAQAPQPGQQQYFAQPQQPSAQQAAPQWPTQPPSAPSPVLQAPGSGAAPASVPGRTNVFGIVALALLVLELLMGPAQTLLFMSVARAGGDGSGMMVTTMSLTFVILLAALLFAILGVRQRDATRFRWAAIGALVASVLSITGALIAALVNAIMAAVL